MRAGDVEPQVVGRRAGTSRPVSAAVCRVVMRLLSTPSRDPVDGAGAAGRCRTRWRTAEDAVGRTNGMASRPAQRRVAEQVHPRVGDVLADAGAAAAPCSTRCALVRRQRPTDDQ